MATELLQRLLHARVPDCGGNDVVFDYSHVGRADIVAGAQEAGVVIGSLSKARQRAGVVGAGQDLISQGAEPGRGVGGMF